MMPKGLLPRQAVRFAPAAYHRDLHLVFGVRYSSGVTHPVAVVHTGYVTIQEMQGSCGFFTLKILAGTEVDRSLRARYKTDIPLHVARTLMLCDMVRTSRLLGAADARIITNLTRDWSS